MIYGLPFVASNFPLWLEFLGQNPAGIPEDATNADAFAETISRLAESPEQLRELSRNGYHLVREKFSWQQEEETLLKLYRSLA
jgi:glycosyltransferase involved in cell wall biosynthesis